MSSYSVDKPKLPVVHADVFCYRLLFVLPSGTLLDDDNDDNNDDDDDDDILLILGLISRDLLATVHIHQERGGGVAE
ncbi:hypothetical protein CHS0354_026471 [Potamilus streckersoni]|uniref:Uncharacterized protein n=1 Tax=Potamilus streckersoni TaxID=2493646 RepID=A0AAE0VI26_9BIVA|nr:hypothetical protein CHS0354_026471 [Potamilus streckersoni]